MDSVKSVVYTCLEISGTSRRSRVFVGSGLINYVGKWARKYIAGDTCTIVTDTHVSRFFAVRVTQSLISAGFKPILITIPAGEKSKTLKQTGAICDKMIAAGLDRHSFVIGLGGGVIGDISGFVAAIYQRGIPHIQIPTTLLGMVDSSIGGKTGVDTRAGKNLIGAFYPPVFVIDDLDLLKTLPRRQFNQGFAEIIKHAIIADAKMFGQLQSLSPRLARQPLTIEQLVCRNIRIKSKIVAQDEYDRTGKRAVLNFGHTVGHAIERAANYRKFLHGEAVSLGIIAACAISVKRAGLPPRQRDAIVALLQRFGLPTRLPRNFARNKIISALKFDKKFENGRTRFVMAPRIGAACLSTEVTIEDIREAVDVLYSRGYRPRRLRPRAFE